MFKQEKCVPCQGGVPPLNADEIKKFKKLISPYWSVENNMKLSKEFRFDSYKKAINFSNLVANLAEDQAHHPYIHINFKVVNIIFRI